MLKMLDSRYHLLENVYRKANEFGPIANILSRLEFKKNIKPIADSIKTALFKHGEQIKNEPIYVLKIPVGKQQVTISFADYSESKHSAGLLHIISPGIIIQHDLEGNIIEYTEIFPHEDKQIRYEFISNGSLTDLAKAFGTLVTVLRYKNSLSLIKELIDKQKFKN